MWSLAVILAALVAVSAAAPQSNGLYESAKHFASSNQREVILRNGSFFPKLDHFRPQDSRIATFHYHINANHHREFGPIFIFVNDIAQSTTRWIEEGLMVDVAASVGAALVTADHRYFGLNIPTNDTSLENLRFLTVDQAVADIAVLVATVREHLASPSSTVILYGVGYGATLATIARKKYPHLIYGVWASSGHFRAEVNDESYFENLSSFLFSHGGPECHGRLHNAFDVLDYLIEHGEGEYVQERLNLCDQLHTENRQEDALLIERFIDLISFNIAQNAIEGIDQFCQEIAFYPEDTLNSLVRWITAAYSSDDCVDIDYDHNIARLSNTSLETAFDIRGRAFQYLRCTQLGTFRIAADYDFVVVPTRLNSQYHFQLCADIFGDQYNPAALYSAVDGLNNKFGGQDNQVITHSIFTNAELDPWISHGISEYDQHESAVFFLGNETQGADLFSISDSDSEQLREAKIQIELHIRRWLIAAIPL